MKRKIEKVYFTPGVQGPSINYLPITVVLCNDSTLWAHALGGGDDSWVSYPPIPQDDFESVDPAEPVKVDCEDCQFGTWQTIVESGGEIPITQRACDHPARTGPVEGWLPIVCNYFTAVGDENP